MPLNETLVDATIKVYSTITSGLLPTPAKSHYTFNLRDLSKVFQGVLMADTGKIQVQESVWRASEILWHGVWDDLKERTRVAAIVAYLFQG